MAEVTNYILSIDPGVSSGVALLSYEEDSEPELVKAWQFRGGVETLMQWVKDHWRESGWDYRNDEYLCAGLHTWGVGLSGVFLSTEVTTDYDDKAAEEERWDDYEVYEPPNLVVIAEKFTARATSGFSYTTASLEPLRCEGALIALGLMPDYSTAEKRWRDPSLQYLVGGKDKADKKRRQHAFLKDSGFYVTGKTLDSPDADDARSAISHGLAYLAREVKHKPTFELITNWEG